MRRDASSGAGIKVLVVDDDAAFGAMIARRLERIGFQARHQPSPFGATALAIEWGPDVVVLDLDMPALDGPKLLSLMHDRRELAGTKFLLFSNTDEAALARVAREGRAHGHLSKSADFGTFVQTLRALAGGAHDVHA